MVLEVLKKGFTHVLFYEYGKKPELREINSNNEQIRK